MALLQSIVVGVVLLLALAHFAASPKKREVLLRRLGLHGRRSSSAQTPPRSISPVDTKASNVEPAPGLKYAFPPSRRAVLKEMYDKLPATLQRQSPEELATLPADSERRSVPLDIPFDELDEELFTPTGFRVKEIRQLGSFPDYTKLSGVPDPAPYHEFDINKALPRPYRPFRWAYHQTMSLTKLEPDWWLELDKSYVKTLQERKEIFKQTPELVFQYLPGSELACRELMEMALHFLTVRYPHCFSLDKQNMIFYNKILDTNTDLQAAHPLDIMMDNIPEDFGIMLRDPKDGTYRLRAAMIVSALGWNVDIKMGKRLHEIHEPVPDYKEKMRLSMDRYFSSQNMAIQRGSWGFEIDTPLFMPPGDPHEKYRDYQMDGLAISRCHLRVDWQTLRRLPLSGAVVFNFKGLFTPVEEFRDEAYIPALALKNLNEAKANIMAYKNCWHNEHVVKPALEEWAKEQEDKGWVPKGWEPGTLDEAPFYPGWQEKRLRQQGF